MPTYDYRCDTCSSHFEFVQSFSDDALTRCPGKRKGGPITEQCTSPGKGKVVKVFSMVGIAFKGDGFYKNDHGSGAATKKPDTEPSSSSSSDSTTKTDTSSSTKTESTTTSSSSSSTD